MCATSASLRPSACSSLRSACRAASTGLGVSTRRMRYNISECDRIRFGACRYDAVDLLDAPPSRLAWSTSLLELGLGVVERLLQCTLGRRRLLEDVLELAALIRCEPELAVDTAQNSTTSAGWCSGWRERGMATRPPITSRRGASRPARTVGFMDGCPTIRPGHPATFTARAANTYGNTTVTSPRCSGNSHAARRASGVGRTSRAGG